MIDPLIITTLILIICLIGLSWFAGSDAPFVPSDRKKVRAIFKKAKLGRGQIFYELGSGDGRVALEAARTGAEVHGIEQSWLRVVLSRLIAKKEGLKNTHFYHGNIFDRSYYPADLVYIYMLQDCVDKLKPKLKKELKKGALVITQDYHFKNWPPIVTDGKFQIFKV